MYYIKVRRSISHFCLKTNLNEKASLIIRLFRIVHAPVFLRCFASDRRHMKDPDGEWIAEPPLHEPIVAEGNEWRRVL